MLNSIVNSLSIWQSEHGKKSMENDPVQDCSTTVNF